MLCSMPQTRDPEITPNSEPIHIQHQQGDALLKLHTYLPYFSFPIYMYLSDSKPFLSRPVKLVRRHINEGQGNQFRCVHNAGRIRRLAFCIKRYRSGGILDLCCASKSNLKTEV